MIDIPEIAAGTGTADGVAYHRLIQTGRTARQAIARLRREETARQAIARLRREETARQIIVRFRWEGSRG